MPLRDAIAYLLPPRIAKNLYWEFWPTWAAYAPLVPVFCGCALRYRGFALPLIANSFAPLAMIAGESKMEILRHIPAAWKPATALVPNGSPHHRYAAFATLLQQGFAFPLILKPDKGFRGQGLRLARTLSAAHAALDLHKGETIVQTFDPGPLECGILYAREPGSQQGRILGITGKAFPFVTGTGNATLAQLVTTHPRLRLQSSRFLARLGARANEVPANGEQVILAVSGNHCQGTMFVDASHLATPALAARCDWLADQVPGLCYGRFDVRYTSDDAIKRGEDFRIVELNGLASEPTHVYDPSMSITKSYIHLARAINELYRLGSLQRSRGARPPTFLQGLRTLRASSTIETTDALAD